MIQLTRINHQQIMVNSDLIEHIEATPDTVLALTTGQKLMVLESPAEIVRRVIAFRRQIVTTNPEPPAHDAARDANC